MYSCCYICICDQQIMSPLSGCLATTNRFLVVEQDEDRAHGIQRLVQLLVEVTNVELKVAQDCRQDYYTRL